MSTSSLTRKTQEVLVFIEEGAHVVKSISCLEPSPAAPHRGARELDLDVYVFCCLVVAALEIESQQATPSVRMAA